MVGKCGLCGQEIPASGSIIDHEDNKLIWCKNCDQYISFCPTCGNQACGFMDPTCMPHLPQIIRKQVRNENMIQIADIPNPERIEAICKSCSCYSKELNCCSRQFGTCANYHFILKEENPHG